jgi:hypothetical protein
MSVLCLPAKRTNSYNQEAVQMNYNQNKKIAQITSETLIIGVDIAKYKHVARAQDFRGLEFGAPCHFENTFFKLDKTFDGTTRNGTGDSRNGAYRSLLAKPRSFS